MEEFNLLEDEIDFNIAKNYENFTDGDTCLTCLYDKNLRTISSKSTYLKLQNPTLNNQQIANLAKFYSANLGTSLFIKKVSNANYYRKHIKDWVSSTPSEKDFQFLIKWIDDQHCFSEYGRIMFFINEPCQKTAIHKDYPDANQKDMFIWLTGNKKKKRLFVVDNETSEEIENPYTACLFDNNNYHYSRGIENHRSWSLRIDGIFNKDWAQKIGIDKHFNL